MAFLRENMKDFIAVQYSFEQVFRSVADCHCADNHSTSQRSVNESRMDRAVFPQTDHELTGVLAAANIFPAKSLYLASNAFTFWMAFRMSELSVKSATPRT